MHKSKNDDAELDVLKKLGYETRDVNLPTLVKVLFWLGTFIAAMLVVSYFILVLFIPEGLRGGSKSVQEVRAPKPGIPVLQAQPKVDMKVFWAAENRKVDTLGWVDKSAGVAHVPVDAVIDEFAVSGKLPSAEPGGTDVLPARGADSPEGALPTGMNVDGSNKKTLDKVTYPVVGGGFERASIPGR